MHSNINLYQFIQTSTLKESECMDLCKKIGQAILHLQTKGVIFCDLEAESILVLSETNKDGISIIPRIARLQESLIIGKSEMDM
mgnify:CR=1 FL=1